MGTENGAGATGRAVDHGREARRIMRGAASATLATAGEGGQPHAALVTPAVAADGTVLLLLSTLSEHTRQLLADPRCAVLFQGVAAEANPQTAPRVSVTGVAEVSVDPALKARWLARHPYAAFYADFGDFALWRVVPAGGLMVLGFGRAHRLGAAALAVGAEELAATESIAAEVGRLIGAEPGLAAAAAHALGGGPGPWQAGTLFPEGIEFVQPEDGRVIFLPLPQPRREPGEVIRAIHAALAK